MTRSALDKDRLMAEASEWLVRLNGEKVGSATRSHFIQWLMRSYSNVDAFLDASRILGEISQVKSMPPAAELAREVREEPRNSNVIHLRPTRSAVQNMEPVAPQPVVSRRSLMKFAAAAAGVAAAGSMAWWGFDVWNHSRPISTQVGEQRSVALEDGTTVQLNTDTALTVRLEKTARRITLMRGEAFFEVAKDANRPFWVTTPQAMVRAVGTAFNVRIIDGRTVVSVIEGHIRVQNREEGSAVETLAPAAVSAPIAESNKALDLFANGQVSVNDGGQVQKDGGPPFDRAVSWPKHHIVFVDEPLSVLVAEFNRYYKQPLEIADPELAEHRVDGGFDVFDRGSLLDYLRRYQGVQIDDEDGKLMMRRAHPVAPGH